MHACMPQICSSICVRFKTCFSILREVRIGACMHGSYAQTKRVRLLSFARRCMLFSDLVKLAMIALHVTASETNCRRLVQWSLWGYTVLGLLKIANHVDYLLGSGFFLSEFVCCRGWGSSILSKVLWSFFLTTGCCLQNLIKLSHILCTAFFWF